MGRKASTNTFAISLLIHSTNISDTFSSLQGASVLFYVNPLPWPHESITLHHSCLNQGVPSSTLICILLSDLGGGLAKSIAKQSTPSIFDFLSYLDSFSLESWMWYIKRKYVVGRVVRQKLNRHRERRKTAETMR